MRCPYCAETNTRVVDSRTTREGRAVRRRRECEACGRRFTTYERSEDRPLSIRKRDGSLEPYDRNKVIRGIQAACAKRPVTREQIQGIADDIEETLERSESGEVESWRIGEQVMDRLKGMDQVAYVRFASVYRNFQDTEEFEEAVRALTAGRGADAAQLDLLGSFLAEHPPVKSRPEGPDDGEP